jgi:hypothetical protein
MEDSDIITENNIIKLIQALADFYRREKKIEVKLCALLLEKETGISRENIFKALEC